MSFDDEEPMQRQVSFEDEQPMRRQVSFEDEQLVHRQDSADASDIPEPLTSCSTSYTTTPKTPSSARLRASDRTIPCYSSSCSTTSLDTKLADSFCSIGASDILARSWDGGPITPRSPRAPLSPKTHAWRRKNRLTLGLKVVTSKAPGLFMQPQPKTGLFVHPQPKTPRTPKIKTPKISAQRRKKLGLKIVIAPADGPLVQPQCSRLTQEYDCFTKLGEGSTGVVYKVRRRADEKDVAVKVMRIDDEELLSIARMEFSVLSQMDHPNIIKGLDFFTYTLGAVLVLEYFVGKELGITVREAPTRQLPESSARHLSAKLFGALSHMHSRGIIHRDIKAENVLVSCDLMDLRVVDFNVAKEIKESTPLTMTGTVRYMPPEVLHGQSPSAAADIWAAGLCLYLMIVGKLPAAHLAKETKYNDDDSPGKGPLVSLQGAKWRDISKPCMEVVTDCLEVRCDLRPTAADILAKPWLASDLLDDLPNAQDCSEHPSVEGKSLLEG